MISAFLTQRAAPAAAALRRHLTPPRAPHAVQRRGRLDIGETAGGLEVRVVEQVFGFGNRRERDPAIYMLRVPARTFRR